MGVTDTVTVAEVYISQTHKSEIQGYSNFLHVQPVADTGTKGGVRWEYWDEGRREGCSRVLPRVFALRLPSYFGSWVSNRSGSFIAKKGSAFDAIPNGGEARRSIITSPCHSAARRASRTFVCCAVRVIERKGHPTLGSFFLWMDRRRSVSSRERWCFPLNRAAVHFARTG